MHASPRYLLPIALCLMIVGCSSQVRTVIGSPALPLACRVQCDPYPTAPPMTSPALDDWLMWGDDVTADYETCRQLHADCVSASGKQVQKNAD